MESSEGTKDAASLPSSPSLRSHPARQVTLILTEPPPSETEPPAPSVPVASRAQLIQRLQRRKEELMETLEPYKETIRRSIFATIRAGVVSQLLAFLQTNLYSVHERDYSGSTPLHIAAHEGRQDMVSVLISFGADLDAVDKYGRTARDVAAANRHSNICRYLLLAATKKQHADPMGGTRESSVDFSLPTPGGIIGIAESPNPDQLSLPLLASSATNAGESIVSPRSLPLGNDEEEEDNLQVSHYCTISDNISVVVCMVGLPGRGKSFISKRLSRYLNWKGIPCKVFNAGNYRRALLGADETAGAEFYDPFNEKAKELREKMAHFACEDLVRFLGSVPVGVGVLDATNTTVERRRHLIEYFEGKEHTTLHKPVRIIFIESVCTDENIITENILRAKCGNDDFKNVSDANTVISEFRDRIRQYEKVYETIEQQEGVSFLKIMNVKEHIVIHRIAGAIGTRIAYFLINLHPVAPPLFIVPHGETIGQVNNQFGGDERLTADGEQFAKRLAAFVLERCGQQNAIDLIHGTNRCVLQTLEPLISLEKRGYVHFHPTRCLDDINYGRMTGETLSDARRIHPKMSQLLFGFKRTTSSHSMAVTPPKPIPEAEYGAIAKPLRREVREGRPRISYQVAFPCGESCRQVNLRIEPVLLHIQRSKNAVVVVSPDIPAAGIVAFFTDTLPEKSTLLELPKHAVIEIGTKGEVQVHYLGSDAPPQSPAVAA